MLLQQQVKYLAESRGIQERVDRTVYFAALRILLWFLSTARRVVQRWA